MSNTNLFSYKEYIIDIEEQTYKAVWNCQVEWTDECIYYDAETGRLEFGDDGIDFISEHQHKVTKGEYLEHVRLAKELPAISDLELKSRFDYRQVI